MSDDGWNNFHRRWSRLKPPLRANDEVVAALTQAIAGHSEHVLLLGVTPELAKIVARTTAVDKSQTMIDHIWPGDTETRRAVLGDWLTMPLGQREFSAVMGDGSLTAIAFEDYAMLFSQLEHLLLPGARFVVRIYETPESSASVAQVRARTMAGKTTGFHAFKWELAMAITSETRNPTIAVAHIHGVFEREFPDRTALSQATGWSHDEISEIDSYRNNPAIYSFPTRRQIMTALPKAFANPRFVPSGTYELAERCPILVADFAP